MCFDNQKEDPKQNKGSARENFTIDQYWCIAYATIIILVRGNEKSFYSLLHITYATIVILVRANEKSFYSLLKFQELFDRTLRNRDSEPLKLQLKPGVSPYYGMAFLVPQYANLYSIEKKKCWLN